MGTASLDLCAVASGRLNACFERKLNLRDHTAGALMATEAEATVEGMPGSRTDHRFTHAAHPSTIAEACALLTDAGAFLVADRGSAS